MSNRDATTKTDGAESVSTAGLGVVTLVDALRCIDQHIKHGMSVDSWRTSAGKVVRRVMFNDGETWADTLEEFAAAIEAVEVIAGLATTEEEFGVRMGWRAPDETPNAELRGRPLADGPA